MRKGVLLGVLVLGIVIPTVAAAAIPFGSVRNVSGTPGDSRHPHMVIDGNGVLHVVWADDTEATGRYRIMHKRSFDRGQNFTSAQVISSGPGAALRPRLAAHGSSLYVVWMEDNSEEKDIMFRRSLDGGASWMPEIQNLSGTPGSSQEARVAVDPDGRVFVVWDEDANHIALRRSFDGGASFQPTQPLFSIVMLRDCSFGQPTGSCTPYPSLTIDPQNGNVYLVWHDWVAGPGTSQVFFSRSLDHGQSFSPRLNVSNGPVHSHCAAITVGPRGTIHVAWEDRKESGTRHFHDAVYAQSINGGLSFSAPRNLSQGSREAFSDYPWPVEAPNGMVVVGWEDNNTFGGELDAIIAVSPDGGASFNPPPANQNVSNNNESTSTEVVTLFGPDGTLYVVWEDYQNGRAEVFLRVAFGVGGGGPGPGPGGRTRFDFDGDGRADLGVYRRSTAEWLIFGSATGLAGPMTFGSPGLGDVHVPADYDGDGRTDLAVFRTTTGEWLVFGSAVGFTGAVQLGVPGDQPVPADYDGDGRADLAVYRPTTAEWFVFGSATGFGGAIVLGSPGHGDVSVPADYDGDGRTDLAVYRPTTAEWFVFGSATGFGGAIVLGSPGLGDGPVPADYDGDGRADLAVFRTTTGEWFIFGSSTGFNGAVTLGAPALGDTPLEGP